MHESSKLHNFSVLESTFLETVINDLVNDIRQHVEKLRSDNLPEIALPAIDLQKYKEHFKSKIDFYKNQDLTVWKE